MGKLLDAFVQVLHLLSDKRRALGWGSGKYTVN